jgi:hypothetical protein
MSVALLIAVWLKPRLRRNLNMAAMSWRAKMSRNGSQLQLPLCHHCGSIDGPIEPHPI